MLERAKSGGDMEISTQHVEGLLAQQQRQAEALSKKKGQEGQFDVILTKELGDASKAAEAERSTITANSAQAGLISQMLLGSTEESQADPDLAVLEQAFIQASGTLDLWETYAKTLGSNGASSSLKDAFAMLQGIDSQVSQIRQDTASVRGKNPGLDSLLNELEVLTATEKFKFNRGDYNI